MKSAVLCLSFVVLFVAASALRAEDAKPAAEGNWTGTLSAKAADAKAGVVATLTVKDGEKETKVNLWAEGDVAKTLTEWAGKGAKAKVTGTAVDATNVKVSKVEEAK